MNVIQLYKSSSFKVEFFIAYLWVNIQDAGAFRGDHLMDGLNLCAVEVAVVLAVLQEAAGLHVHLHLHPRGKVVGVSVQLVVTGPP